MSQTLYIAGPMRGIKDFNFPAFHEADAHLTALGYHVFNVAKLEEATYGVGFNESETGDLADIKSPDWDFKSAFALDCHIICKLVDGIVCLPGWDKSKGARAEVAIARALGLFVMSYPDLKPIPE